MNNEFKAETCPATKFDNYVNFMYSVADKEKSTIRGTIDSLWLRSGEYHVFRNSDDAAFAYVFAHTIVHRGKE